MAEHRKGQFEKGHEYHPHSAEKEEERRKKIGAKNKGHPYHPVKSLETEALRREKIRQAKLGKKRPDLKAKWERDGDPNWNGGNADPEDVIRRSSDARSWRRQVLERDKSTCQFCGSKKGLHAHHILDHDDHPDERLSVDNGITLCKGCHVFVYSLIDYTPKQVLDMLK